MTKKVWTRSGNRWTSEDGYRINLLTWTCGGEKARIYLLYAPGVSMETGDYKSFDCLRLAKDAAVGRG